MIRFENVTKRFPDGTLALDGLNLDIPDGKITVLVGASGCGKTTTLRMINRMIEPTGGRVLIDGLDVRESDPPRLRRGIGYVIQQAGLFPHRTVAANVATVPRLLGWARPKAKQRALELLELVGLPASYATRYPHQLSGGQQQRVGVARALAADPPILLMDEPFSAVDPIVRASLQDELLRLQSELRKTIVFVTHDVDEAIRLGDLVGVFRPGGGLVQFDTPARLLAQPADDYVDGFLGNDRGLRRLATLPATALTPSAVDRAAGWELSWPEGWIGPDGQKVPIGRTFDPAADSMRSALDCAVLSPAGLAVAARDGTLLGTVSQAEILAAVHA
ncbi:ABC transporter ATP-binding protein [Longispora albida]|uniref:ABC transporter ATP-binding protein n=1 Tax=Longispora albida TaxID=203523 RepID=UPI00035EACC8|nr:ATP-binding cassette domain-containing protein [Longispora albida]